MSISFRALAISMHCKFIFYIYIELLRWSEGAAYLFKLLLFDDFTASLFGFSLICHRRMVCEFAIAECERQSWCILMMVIVGKATHLHLIFNTCCCTQFHVFFLATLLPPLVLVLVRFKWDFFLCMQNVCCTFPCAEIYDESIGLSRQHRPENWLHTRGCPPIQTSSRNSAFYLVCCLIEIE